MLPLRQLFGRALSHQRYHIANSELPKVHSLNVWCVYLTRKARCTLQTYLPIYCVGFSFTSSGWLVLHFESKQLFVDHTHTHTHTLQGGFTGPENSLGLRILSYYLIFFPSLDVMSAFPLTVHCIVNNIYIIITGRDTSEKPRWRYDWLLRFILRFVAAILPLLAALGIANLIYVLKYAGLFGFAIALFFPAILQLRSIYVCSKEFKQGSSEVLMLAQHQDLKSIIEIWGILNFRQNSRRLYVTPYSRGLLSHPMVVMAIVCVGLCLFVLAITSLGIGPHKITCSLDV